MKNLPCDVLNNILLIRYDGQLKTNKKLKDKIHELNDVIVKLGGICCESCKCWGTDDEISYNPDYEEYQCQECSDMIDDDIGFNQDTYPSSP